MMLGLLICGVVAWYVGIVVMTLALCKVSAQAERRLETLNTDRVFQDE